MRRLSRLAASALKYGAKRCHASVREPLEVFVVRPGEQVEEGIEAAIERAAELRDGAVEGVQRHAGGRAVGQG